MDAIAAAEERIVSERLKQKINEVNISVQTQFAGIHDHVSFTLQVLQSLLSLSIYPYTDNSMFNSGPFLLIFNGYVQQAYYRCAYECFDRRRNQEEIGRCVEHCSVPVHNAQNLFQNEMAKFQVKLISLFLILFFSCCMNLRSYLNNENMLLVTPPVPIYVIPFGLV